ncbi:MULTISPECIES: dephospho-CoA kinase [unclassified Paenibacillus]|uniref:dephospho-CoA kinase n=1 Tax=unclassified Paenibacillus TaxID=185978 RepID=UPI0009A7895B|nr:MULTISPECIES: dephospho-CoA kinase [unclassified Paenibacillus]SLK22594.1 dephospho-CoA kinase [Paenibacillus sp. RU5A]SOC77281.1 dephospho-CoA kinase [Paenibacillus sp. RU26A]SOC78365.1 dephospho-CoA kinase [Paenibacillus sp. RU5M]
MNIGLTGGIATGKSSVSAFLASKGALLIDADVIAREVMLPGHPVLAAAVQRFGQAILNEDGTLDRKKLGSIVFQNPEERKALEAITHPAIRKEMRERAALYELEHSDKLVVSDIPLLYESGLEDGFEEVMVVYVPRSVQLERLMSRDGMTAEQADARIDVQMDIEDKKQRADVVIDNSGLWSETEQQLISFLHRKGLI